jgi:hypothetical protein
MINKPYNLIVIILLSTSAFASLDDNSPWSNSPVGTCSQITKQAENSPEDDDSSYYSKSFKGKHGETFTWNWDNTPSRNLDRVLNRMDHSGRLCAILYLPSSDTYSFKLNNDGSLPTLVKSRTSPMALSDGSYEELEVTYKLKSSGYYGKYPASCRKITNDKSYNKINCLTAFN